MELHSAFMIFFAEEGPLDANVARFGLKGAGLLLEHGDTGLVVFKDADGIVSHPLERPLAIS